jgi:hypothetical protein
VVGPAVAQQGDCGILEQLLHGIGQRELHVAAGTHPTWAVTNRPCY